MMKKESNDSVDMDVIVEETTEISTSKRVTRGCVVKFAILAALIALLVYVIVDSFTTGNVKAVLSNFLEEVEKLGFVGALLFALVYVLATVLLIPGTILTLGAGFVFTKTNGNNQLIGTFVAATVVFVGATIGATLAYLLGRFLLRDTVSKWTHKYKVFRAVDRAIESNGLKIVFLLRLSPAIPFNVLNYLLGITAVSLKQYIIACFGLIPGTIAFCFIGSTLGSLSDVEDGGKEEESSSSKTVKLVVLIIGIVATILVVIAITIYAKKELNKHLEEDETEDDNPAENLSVSNSSVAPDSAIPILSDEIEDTRLRSPKTAYEKV